jgi:hypothetical protein
MGQEKLNRSHSQQQMKRTARMSLLSTGRMTATPAHASGELTLRGENDFRERNLSTLLLSKTK